MRSRINVLTFAACLTGLWLAWPAAAQVGTREARGTVQDAEGNPIEGAVVTFKAKANTANEYSGTTNKKGRYFIAGLWTPKEDDYWEITFSKEGYLPIKAIIESRTVNRVLTGNLTEALGWGEKIPEITIRPMGSAQVDLIVSPEDAVRDQAMVEAQAAAASAAEGGGAAAGSPGAPPKGDPWTEAVALASAGDLAGAVPLFDKAIAEKADDAERHEAYAKVLYQLGRFDEATAPALRAVELAPARLEARMVLYSVYVGQEDFERARETLGGAREIAPADTRVLDQLAYVAQRTGRREDAIGAYQAMVAADPQNADAWLSLGDLYSQAGDLQRSEEAYRKVIELNPAEAYQTFYNLGAMIMNRPDRGDADTQKAIDAFRKAIQIRPDYAPAQQQLGLALLGAGDRSGARAALEAYVKLRPKASDVSQMQALIQALQP